MNKIIFSEGGQPVYLDDMQLLQDICLNVSQNILSSLGCKSPIYLLNPLNFEKTETGLLIKKNSIVVNGRMFFWENTEIVSDSIDNVYVYIQTIESDFRIFEDMQERACILRENICFTTNIEGISEYYVLPNIPILSNLFCDYIQYPEWEDVEVVFYNGFSGTVRKKKYFGETHYEVNLVALKGNFTEDIKNADGSTKYEFPVFMFKNIDDVSLIGMRRYPIVFAETVLPLYIRYDGYVHLAKEVSDFQNLMMKFDFKV